MDLSADVVVVVVVAVAVHQRDAADRRIFGPCRDREGSKAEGVKRVMLPLPVAPDNGKVVGDSIDVRHNLLKEKGRLVLVVRSRRHQRDVFDADKEDTWLVQ